MKFVYLIKITLFFFICTVVLGKKVIIYDRFYVCENPETSPHKWGKVNMRRINYHTYIDSELDLLRDVNKVSSVLKITRCANKELLDSCEFFGNFPFKDTCFLYTQKDGFFYDYATSFTPNLQCPFKKGHYVQVNGTFDPELFNYFPIGNWYWKTRNELYDYYTGELLFTFCIECSLINIRD